MKIRIWGVFCQLNLVSKKDPMQKCAKNAQQLSNIEQIFLALFAHSAFYKIYIFGEANRHVPVQYAKYVVVFFLSSHHDMNPLLHLSVLALVAILVNRAKRSERFANKFTQETFQ